MREGNTWSYLTGCSWFVPEPSKRDRGIRSLREQKVKIDSGHICEARGSSCLEFSNFEFHLNVENVLTPHNIVVYCSTR